jgi:microcystin-dependent protein
MSDPFLGEIRVLSFNFAPKGWAGCDGQLMAINQNQALFALLGTQYGGDGIRTFAIPDLRGRVAIHRGQGPGLNPYTIGERGGTEGVTLTVAQIPAHTHTALGSSADGTTLNPTGAIWAKDAVGGTEPYLTGAVPNAPMAPQAISSSGSNVGHPNLQPFLVTNFCIALQGIFPSRN